VHALRSCGVIMAEHVQGAVHGQPGELLACADAPHARSEGAELDDELKVGDKVGPFVVVGAPGKSLGEVVLHWPERKILLVGDAVVGDPPGKCKLLPDKVVDDPPRFRESARGLLTLDFDALLVGDGVPILQSAKERLQELIQTF